MVTNNLHFVICLIMCLIMCLPMRLGCDVF